MNEKVKVQIKHRLTGTVLFEYETVDNDLRKTVLEALQQHANLRGANLRGADLRGANLRGSVLDYNDDDGGYGSVGHLIKHYRENFGIDLGEVYENHDTFSCTQGWWWQNLIIIRQWRIIEEPEEKVAVQLTDIQKEAIKAFAKLHKVDMLQYQENNETCRLVAQKGIYLFGLGLATKVDGLSDNTVYRLAELGIED